MNDSDDMRCITNRHDDERHRLEQLRDHVGCCIELLAGADDLTADRGIFLFIHAGDGHDEPTAVVEFKRNGRWAIPISMLYVPGEDHVRQETTAFIIAGRGIPERQLMSVSFELVHGRTNDKPEWDEEAAWENDVICDCDCFGNCPDCRDQSAQNGCGHLNIGPQHWGYCNLHKSKWYIGENLFSSWRDEGVEDWERNEALLEAATDVEPWFCDACLARRKIL